MKQAICWLESAEVKLSVDAQIPMFLYLPFEFLPLEMERDREISKSQRAQTRGMPPPAKATLPQRQAA